MGEVTTRIGSGGRVVIPAGYRKALGIEPGDEVVLLLEGDAVRILPLRHAIARARALVRPYVTNRASLVAELLAERRDAARQSGSGYTCAR